MKKKKIKESPEMDMKMDKKKGIKEGSKKDESLDKKMLQRTTKKVSGFDDSALRGALVSQGAIKKRTQGRPKKRK